MESAKPLWDVFNELVGDESARQALAADRDALLRDSGHGDLPGGLVAEAVVSYADTAPVEVAEHLAPFVTAHSVVPPDGPAAADPDPTTGLDLLATVPAGAPDLAVEPDEGWIDGLVSAETGPDPVYSGPVDGFDLAFGAGGASAEDGGRIGDSPPYEPDAREDGIVPDEPDWTVDPPDLTLGVAGEPGFSDEDADATDEEEPAGDGGG